MRAWKKEIVNLDQKRLPSGCQILQMPYEDKLYVSGGVEKGTKFYEIKQQMSGKYVQQPRKDL